ncbi:MAG: FkbM family methyltransferase [Elusimicrobiota bacterium]|jgi:hypothetical protein|nr:FkbM family methyltransferase [Elusimicrobiota bacterium]
MESIKKVYVHLWKKNAIRRLIKNWLKARLEWLCPFGISEILRKKHLEHYYRKHPRESEIRNYFLNLKYDEQDAETIEVRDYLKENVFSVFPYSFALKGNSIPVEVFLDEIYEMHFVLYEGKRMYFPKGWTIAACINYFRGLCIEQDAASPHRYETKKYIPKPGDVIADIGAAEGIWALKYAQDAKKIFLFESEPNWIQALERTFAPYKEKTTIINKYISDKVGNRKTTLDAFFKDMEVNFIKADIEGAEVNALKGGKSILQRMGGGGG